MPAVDTLRGVALAGMLVVHFQYYAEGPEVWGDRVEALDTLLFTSRFHALFAFLFGVGFVLAVRTGVLRQLDMHRRLLWTVLVAGALLGLASNAPNISAWLSGESLRLRATWNALQWAILSERFQGLAYAAAILLWISHGPTFPRPAALLALAGRMSLTNYVVQICFLELVFAVGGVKITRPTALLATAVVFTVQIAYSGWWLQRFRMGPLEWLWRSVTYWRVEPLRVQPRADVLAV